MTQVRRGVPVVRQPRDDDAPEWREKVTNALKYLQHDVFNVGQYGRDLQSGADATKAIQEAVNDAGENGGTVRFDPVGTYVITQTISVPLGSIHIDLNGSKIKMQGEQPCFSFNHSHDFESAYTLTNGMLEASSAGQGTGVRLRNADRTILQGIVIKDFNYGVHFASELDTDFCESVMLLNVTIRGCNRGLFFQGHSGGNVSFGQTRFIGVNISAKGAVAGTPYGVYQGVNASLYRSFFAPLTIWTEKDNTIAYYCDGAWNSIHGEIAFERQGRNNVTGVWLGPSAKLPQGNITFKYTGTLAADFRVDGNLKLDGIYKNTASTRLYKAGVRTPVWNVEDLDGVVRWRLLMSGTDTPQIHGKTAKPLEFRDIDTDLLLPIRARNLGWVRTADDGDTTPSVADATTLILNNTGATTITDFEDAISGQDLLLLDTAGTSDIADSGNFKLSALWNPAADGTLHLRYINSTWYEIARSNN
jgi:hypothetical protein